MTTTSTRIHTGVAPTSPLDTPMRSPYQRWHNDLRVWNSRVA